MSATTTFKFLGVTRNLLSNGFKCRSTAILQRRCISKSSQLNNLETASSPIPPPGLENAPKVYDDKIVSIVNNISNLTLREVADLNELLKSTLNITDVPMMAAAAAAAPSAAPVQEEVVEEKVPEKTEFAIRLVEFAAPDKIKLIKAIKSIKKELNLVQAKKFVESLPQIIRDDASKEESEEIQKLVEAAGGKVTVS